MFIGQIITLNLIYEMYRVLITIELLSFSCWYLKRLRVFWVLRRI